MKVRELIEILQKSDPELDVGILVGESCQHKSIRAIYEHTEYYYEIDEERNKLVIRVPL